MYQLFSGKQLLCIGMNYAVVDFPIGNFRHVERKRTKKVHFSAKTIDMDQNSCARLLAFYFIYNHPSVCAHTPTVNILNYYFP